MRSDDSKLPSSDTPEARRSVANLKHMIHEDLMFKYFNLRRMVLRYIGEKPNSEEHKNLKAFLDVSLGPEWDAVTEPEDQYLDRKFAERTSGTSAPPI